jgi:hypothetical protein
MSVTVAAVGVTAVVAALWRVVVVVVDGLEKKVVVVVCVVGRTVNPCKRGKQETNGTHLIIAGVPRQEVGCSESNGIFFLS